MLSAVLGSVVHFAPAIHNTFHALPQHLVPLYIITIKLTYVFYFAVFMYRNFFSLKGRHGCKQ